jgi:phenylpropionate dioxygenase-like ring-hydroxylating dioxygenase large terminal subunit
MALNTQQEVREPFHWPESGNTRIPFRLFSDEAIYAQEQEKIFRGPVWNFLCMEFDVAQPGDFKTTFVGETPVIVTRDHDGELHALVNRCAHKGALVCLRDKGNARNLTCVYHAWSYAMDGRLRGLAFRNGIGGKGGMPDDFDISQHRLQPLRAEAFCGMVFGTFCDETPPVEDYLGKTMADFVRRNLGRPLKPLGVQSQIIHNNWKLYAENLRDSYHATLLHTFYTTFKVNRLDMDGGIIIAPDKWHHISYAKRKTLEEDEEYKKSEVHSAQYDNKLQGPQLLDTWDEFDDGITHSIQAFFPNLCIHFTLNSLCVRHYLPRGVDKTELFWIYLGYESDTEEETEKRVMQVNLTGSAGLVSMEDGCINNFVQRGTRGSEDRSAFMEMGGTDDESSENSRATEAAIRGFWTGYRRIMGF